MWAAPTPQEQCTAAVASSEITVLTAGGPCGGNGSAGSTGAIVNGAGGSNG